MERYSIIEEKQPREIVLLRGQGCKYKKCAFCDYHLDCSPSKKENYELNSQVLSRVTGVHRELEVINSGSAFELDKNTLNLIKTVCGEKRINTLHFESHYLYREKLSALRRYFVGIDVKIKIGLETFDYNFRERVLKKGIKTFSASEISEGFNEANLLVGVKGQTLPMIKRDVALGLKYFERICVNVFCANSTKIEPDAELIAQFLKEIYPTIKDNPRIDILINNTDFGVGD